MSGRTTTQAASPTAAAEPEEDLTTGTVRAEQIDLADEDRNTRMTRDNQRIGAIEGLARTPEEDPYAPLGMRLGTFVFTPRLEQGIGATTNGSSSPGGGSSVFSETALRLNAISDWSRHSAALQADGIYRKSLSGEEIDEFEGGISADIRLDLGDQWQATGSVAYRVRPESASSPTFIEGTVSQPLRHTFSGSAGVSRELGRLKLGVTGAVERNLYDDADLSSGGVISQADRDSVLSTVALRTGFELSPAITPFLEAEIGRRNYDEEFDRDGFARSADRYAIRGGVELDLSEKTTGEFSIGWLEERPDDDRLSSISGLALAGNLQWSPVRGTIVELNGATTVEGSTTAGDPGSLLYSGSLALRRELRANLTGTASAGLDWRDYSGSSEHDLILSGELGLTWWMNRFVGVTGRARHEVQRSSIDDRDYDATSVFLGMTLQR
ncbi:outer membrane beta-barrel protein [Mesorhizobium sp. CAU 1732]|uniref:outer membrane beta-barrel protein n=1 Tax=Mesorhizobium sp. CAU 1732 TaxID=3140358 RepID=UPI00326154A8